MISTLHFDNARIAQQLFSNNPRNLQMLEVRMSVKATNRDMSTMNVRGTA